MKLKEFNKKHDMDFPEGNPTSYYVICSCGADWYCYYGQGNHLTWVEQNDLCKTHDDDWEQVEDKPYHF